MLILLAKDRFFWTLSLSGRPLKEAHHWARWKVARIQSPVSVRSQHAWKTPCQLSPKRRGQLAPTHAFARHLAIGVAIDIYQSPASLAAARAPRAARPPRPRAAI